MLGLVFAGLGCICSSGLVFASLGCICRLRLVFAGRIVVVEMILAMDVCGSRTCVTCLIHKYREQREIVWAP